MAKPYYLFIFVLAIALAYSQSQTPSGTATTGQNAPGNSAGSIYGNTSAANPQTPTQGNTQSQPLPSTSQSTPAATGAQAPSKPGSATDASGGGVAGSAGTAPAQTPETPVAAANPAISDSDLQSQIQNALSKEPTLAGESVRISVADDSIEMQGNVATAKEKLTATRIVQSYAGNKKVVSHVTISGRPAANPSSATQPPQN
jgi:hypothetical protein